MCLPAICGKTGTNVELFNVPTYQCSILCNNVGSFNWKSAFRRPENLNKPVAKSEKFNVADFSLLRELWRNNYAHVILTERLTAYRQTRSSCLRTMAWWDATQAEAMICQSTQELIPQGMFASCGNQVKKTTKYTCSDL